MRPDRDQQPAPRVGPVIVGCLALAGLSLLLPSTITFDPLTWATWARELVHLHLDTVGGPAWKPLPVLVDIIFVPLGQAEKWVWLVVARAGGLLAVAMAYRLATRLAGRWAGLIGAAGMALSQTLLEYLLPLGMSEPLMAGLGLLAIERHLDGKHGEAYGLIFACLLLRPETFPFFLAYSVFLWRRNPRSRPWAVGLTLSLPVLWLYPDYLGSGNWLRSEQRASMPTQGGPLLTGHPGLAVLESAFNAVVLPVVAGAAIAAAFAIVGFVKRREEATLLALCVLCVTWIVEEAVVTQLHMGSGDQRYLIFGYAVGCVLAGVGWVRLVAAAPTLLRTQNQGVRVAVIVVAVAACAPFVYSRLDQLSGDAGEIPYQAHKYSELVTLINEAGGRQRVLACGPLTSDIYQMPALAWDLDIHQAQIIIGVRRSGTVVRTRTTRGSPLVPPKLGSAKFHLVASTAQWQLLSTCASP